jgi:hypothetical protein
MHLTKVCLVLQGRVYWIFYNLCMKHNLNSGRRYAVPECSLVSNKFIRNLPHACMVPKNSLIPPKVLGQRKLIYESRNKMNFHAKDAPPGHLCWFHYTTQVRLFSRISLSRAIDLIWFDLIRLCTDNNFYVDSVSTKPRE